VRDEEMSERASASAPDSIADVVEDDRSVRADGQRDGVRGETTVGGVSSTSLILPAETAAWGS
jgi:hypothetical protein